LAIDPSAKGSLVGAWWPQSRDLDVEVADLVDNFPGPRRIARLGFSRPDWSTHPRSVNVARGRLKVGSFPKDDTHIIVLTLSDHTRVNVLVIPPDHPDGPSLMKRDYSVLGQHDAGVLLSPERP
jgi:hypothetical protein